MRLLPCKLVVKTCYKATPFKLEPKPTLPPYPKGLFTIDGSIIMNDDMIQGVPALKM